MSIEGDAGSSSVGSRRSSEGSNNAHNAHAWGEDYMGEPPEDHKARRESVDALER